MKKKAIIIANQDALLPGVAKDIEHIQSFLKGVAGGAWNTDEIDVKINPKKSDLSLYLSLKRLMGYDYIMVFFTGHGGHKRNETYVCINNEGEMIAQSQLENISRKQMNIYDCCRSELESLSESKKQFSVMDSLESRDMSRLSKEEARRLYERAITQAKPQQLILYSCSLNEYSQDESYGALYLTNLLKDAINFANTKYMKGFKLALESHANAAERVKKDNRDYQNPQTPDCKTTRFPSVSDHLIISINPMRYAHY